MNLRISAHRFILIGSKGWLNNSGIVAHLKTEGRLTYTGQVVQSAPDYSYVKLIVLTHAHFDHAENAAQISNALGIPIGMSQKDCNLIQSNANQILSAESFLGKIVLSVSLKDFSARTLQEFQPDIFLKDGDSLSAYGVNASIIALPGHTDGSIGIDVENKGLIVGDALMNMFYPTVSMLYHDKSEMLDSAGKISRLGNRTIYFGHGKSEPNKQWVKQRTVCST